MCANTNTIEKQYDWWVVSTAIVDVVLILECQNTGAMGVVRNPTEKEWADAFYAPSSPYRWHQSERVEIQRAD